MKLKFWKKEKRHIEDPNTPLSPANIEGSLVQMMGFGPGKTKSGASVGPDSAWNYTAVYAAIRLLSETVAQLPLVLHRKEGDNRRPAYEHPLYGLMHDNPSDQLTSFVWRETQMGHVLSWGNGYAHIQREQGTRTPQGLSLLSPKFTEAVVDTAGSFFYLTEVNGKKHRIDPRDVLHIPALGFDGFAGKSPITLHRETIGLSMRATEFGAEFFGNGASLGGVLKHPKGLGKEGRVNLKESWDRFKGAGYQGTALLEEGMDYTRIGIPPNDAQFIETRKFQISEIARIYNVPPHMLRDLEKSAFNNMTEQSIEFLRYTMTPWLVKWEQELNRKLLTPEERADGYYFKFMVNGLLRGTQKDRYEAYGKGIQDGWLVRNEARGFEDLDPIDGLDAPLMPLNMVPVGQEPEGEEDQDDSDEAVRYMPIIERAVDSLVAYDQGCLRNAATKGELIARYAQNGAGTLERHIAPVLQTIDAGRAARWGAEFAKWWGDYRANQGLSPLDKDILTTQLLTIIGGNYES